jgi:hypothetical protein
MKFYCCKKRKKGGISMKTNRIIFGILLIAFGVLLFISSYLNLFTITWRNAWPFSVILVGLAFEFSFFFSPSPEKAGLLVPGGILTVIGALFFFETYTSWLYAKNTWPVYLLAVAFGLFQLYLFSGRPPGLLMPVSILTALGCGALLLLIWQLKFSTILAIGLILAGVLIIFCHRKRD